MTTTIENRLNLYKLAKRIRLIEEKISLEYANGKMRCPVHLSIGQEIVSAIIGLNQDLHDSSISTHRAHAHYLAKGGNLYRMFAEILGKSTGCCMGRGGSMHLIDIDVNFLGSSAIVGNSIPIGVGVGYSYKLRKFKRISFVHFGDGATEEGVFYESLNFAAVNKVPVIFICENNRYSVYTNLSKRQPQNRSISRLATEIGVSSITIDDSDPFKAFQIATEFIEAARSSKLPALIEFNTYRWLEHCGPNDDDELGYRPKGELEALMSKDPLEFLLQDMLEKREISRNDINKFITQTRLEIDEAYSLAINDPFPSLESAMSGTYAE